MTAEEHAKRLEMLAASFYRSDPNYRAYPELAEACEAGALALRRPTWIPVGQEMPVPGREVLVCVQMVGATTPITRRLRAQWNDGKTLPLSSDADDAHGWYDEERDEYFCAPGWYETNEFEECHWKIAGDVTHWQPLPAPPEAP